MAGHQRGDGGGQARSARQTSTAGLGPRPDDPRPLRRSEQSRRELKAANPQDIDAIELDGLVARGQGRLADAEAAFARALALKDNAVDRRRLADTQLHLGRPDDAVKTLTTWLDIHPEDAETRKMLADRYKQFTGNLVSGKKTPGRLTQQS